MEFLNSADFWIGLVKIIWINIILSGDNAVVIALAARSLPPEQQKKAIMFGSGAAVVLRIVLTVVAAKLLELSFLQIVGGILLLWIGYQLLSGGEEDEGDAKGSGGMMAAIRTILIADLVMSLDNVIAVAAAAHDLQEGQLQQLGRHHRENDPQHHGGAGAEHDGFLLLFGRKRTCREGDDHGVVAGEDDVDPDDLHQTDPEIGAIEKFHL